MLGLDPYNQRGPLKRPDDFEEKPENSAPLEAEEPMDSAFLPVEEPEVNVEESIETPSVPMYSLAPDSEEQPEEQYPHDEPDISVLDPLPEKEAAEDIADLYSHLALVAGATGITGREVVASLAGRGIETLAHIRPDSPYVNEWIEYFRQVGSGVDTTAWKQDDFSQRLTEIRPSLVFCLLGSSDRRITGDGNIKSNPFVDSYMAVDYGLTSMLIRACTSAGEENLRFILVSAMDSDEKSQSEFLRMKAKAEEFLIQSGLNYTIVRVGSIIESDRGGREQLKRAGLLGIRRKLPDFEAVKPRPLAETLVDVALDPECANRIFETDV